MDQDILRIFLPRGIVDWFDLEECESTDTSIRMTFREKNVVPPLPAEHRSKNVVSKGFKEILVDDFPIRGKKTELLLFRRIWLIEGTETLLKRDIEITAPGTKLEKAFASFLKELDRSTSGIDQQYRPSKFLTYPDAGEAIQGGAE